MTPWQFDLALWYSFAALFAVSALRVKRTKVQQKSAERLIHLGCLTAAAALVFSSRLDLGFLAARFLPVSTAPSYAGVGVTVLGLGLGIWSRRTLGQYWSGRATLKVDHKLVRSGPYSWVRHPLYTGVLTALLGTSLVVGEWRAVIGFMVATVGFSLKARREEAMLSSEFADEYTEYRQRAGFLLPKLLR